MRLKFVLSALALGVATTLPLWAQAQFDFYSRGPYRSLIPKPAAITGYEPGTHQTPHGAIVRVLEQIAATAPDRVKLLELGQTAEYRKLYLAVVSAPENINRLAQIRANLNLLADPRRTTPAQAAEIAKNTPMVVWLNFGIHGNESASYETVQQVLYQLAASDEPKTLDILKNVVVVINTMQNPDGHERFAVWENSVAVGDPERFSLEHKEPYTIYGRLNHYRFDMNRDMLALSQRETRAVAQGVLTWRPQVFTDFHGQVSSYFFPPVADPVNQNIPVANSQAWYEKFGRGNASAFDRYGWNYYVRHIFDLFYAGYMDSWASLNGATGMTYETDGGGPRSLNLRQDDDTILTFQQGIAKHYVAALATLETAAANRSERLEDYYRFFKSGLEEGRNGKIKQFVLLPNPDPGRTSELVKNLLRKGIEVQVARSTFRSERAHDFNDAPVTSREFPAGSYIVDLAQPQKRLAKAQLEPDATLDPAFIQRELERRTRNERKGAKVEKEDYEFYDITTWSLPLAQGIASYWTEDDLSPKASAVRLTGEALTAADGGNLPGVGGGGVQGGKATTAYLWPMGSEGAARLAFKLLAEDFKVAVATRPLSAGGRVWPVGTLLTRVTRNPEALHARIATLAQSAGTTVTAMNSAYNDMGDTGIGSETVVSLKPPKIAVVWDEDTNPTNYGSLWYTLEQGYGQKFTPVSLGALKRASLSKFNVIVLPDGDPDSYEQALGKSGIEKLKAWIKEGGVLVALEGGAVFCTQKDVDFTTARVVGEDEKSDKPLPVPGTAFRAQLDRDHFLSYGYAGDQLTVLVEGDAFLKPSKEGANLVRFPKQVGVVSGFIWPNNTTRLLAETSYVVDEPLGRGHVVLFAKDPNYRYLWRTANGLFINSLLLGPAF